MKALIFLMLSAMSSLTFAEAILPEGCQAIAVQGEQVTLKTKKNTLVYIHNLGQTDLWMTHPMAQASASAGWSSRLQTDHWSALLVNKTSFTLNCIESIPGHEQQIPCEGTVAVCQWNKLKVPSHVQGTFWVAEDQTLAGLSASVSGRGFPVSG